MLPPLTDGQPIDRGCTKVRRRPPGQRLCCRDDSREGEPNRFAEKSRGSSQVWMRRAEARLKEGYSGPALARQATAAVGLLRCSQVASCEVRRAVEGDRMAQGSEKRMRFDSSARSPYVKRQGSLGALPTGLRPPPTLRDAAAWLYRAELRRSGMQLPRLFRATQLHVTGPQRQGDCILPGGQRHRYVGKCMGARAPTQRAVRVSLAAIANLNARAPPRCSRRRIGTGSRLRAGRRRGTRT
jgi:hypothetical protein